MAGLRRVYQHYVASLGDKLERNAEEAASKEAGHEESGGGVLCRVPTE
jgi:hypothetical protein